VFEAALERVCKSTTRPAAPAEVANPSWNPPPERSRRAPFVGLDVSHRPFFLPLFTRVLNRWVFSEVRMAAVQHL